MQCLFYFTREEGEKKKENLGYGMEDNVQK